MDYWASDLEKTSTSGRRYPVIEPIQPDDTPLVIASSAGGPDALRKLLAALPAGLAVGGVIVQHMAPNFTRIMADSLNLVGWYRVKEARAGDVLQRGLFLVAPGGYHLAFNAIGQATLIPGPKINTVQPAADVTMISLAKFYRSRLIGVVLTGIGTDGLAGAREIRALGGTVMAQDKESSFIYGMPRAVVEANLARIVASPEMLALVIAGKVKQLLP